MRVAVVIVALCVVAANAAPKRPRRSEIRTGHAPAKDYIVIEVLKPIVHYFAAEAHVVQRVVGAARHGASPIPAHEESHEALEAHGPSPTEAEAQNEEAAAEAVDEAPTEPEVESPAPAHGSAEVTNEGAESISTSDSGSAEAQDENEVHENGVAE